MNMNERQLIRDQLINRQQQPVVFSGFISDWKAASWTPRTLTEVFGDDTLEFRLGKLKPDEVQWENNCTYVGATITEFIEWTNGSCSTENPLYLYDRKAFWCYADYKYMAEIFQNKPQFLKVVDWSVFGFDNRGGLESTFWLGSQGANTVCHYDTYGCNLIAQIHGKKRWVLFPPSDTRYMYPTRIPFEESSVFSQVPVKFPNIQKFPEFKQVTPHVVTLEPGDVLFVPPKWWHFVESLETSISINTWIEMDSDDDVRLQEAVSRTMAFMLMTDSEIELSSWLNPTEDLTDKVQNFDYIRMALTRVLEKGCTVDLPKDNAVSLSLAKKRSYEDSFGDKVEEKVKRMLVNEQVPTFEVVSEHSVDIVKEYDTFDQLEFLVDRVKKVTPSDWNEYCKQLETDTQSLLCDSDSLENSGFIKGCNDTRQTAISLAPDKDAILGNGDTISLVTSTASSSSDVSFGKLTDVDLADVLLDPEVIDLICSKLIRKFKKPTIH